MKSTMMSDLTSSLFDPHWALYPLAYVAPRAPLSFVDQLDGDLTKDIWANVPWSDAFHDIQGKTSGDPAALTQFMAQWDDDHLYIGAILHPSDDFNTQVSLDYLYPI
jgi:hypothetical protein